ncbi:MAG: TonB-dependent receptor [Bryobacteraceae bacterium]|jgi:hypothetical protein
MESPIVQIIGSRATAPRPRRALIAFLLCAALAPAQQSSAPAKDVPVTPAASASLRGRVIDFKTGEPIAKALIWIRSPDRRAVTDENGRFEIPNVAPGEADVYVSTVDYGLLQQRIQVEADGPREFEFLLGQESLKHSDRITVTAEPFVPVRTEDPVEQSINNTELKNLSGVLVDDPLRAVQSMPGVAANSDLYAQFTLRGAEPADIGIFVNGALMRAPFRGIIDDRGNSVSFSLLSNSFVDSMTLLSGNFPVQYGDIAGSILDVQTREGNTERTSYRADVSMLAASFTAEGPLGDSKKASWLVSGQKDYVSLVTPLVGGSVPNLSLYEGFGDLSYNPTAQNRISLTVLGGGVSYGMTASSVSGTDGFRNGTGRSGLASLRWTWSDASTISQAQVYGSSDSGWAKDLSEDPLERSSGSEMGFREDLTHQMAWNKFQAGAEYRWFDRDFVQNEPWNYSTEEFSATLIQSAQFSKSASQPGAYVQDTISFGKRVTIVAGWRWDHFSRYSQNTFLPRVSLSASLLRNTKLIAAAGQYSRFPDLVDLYGEFGTPTLRAERSTQLSLALEHLITTKTRVRVEAYDRQIRDGIYSAASQFRANSEGSILYPQLGPVLANSLRGYSRGVEFTLQRRSANRLTGWISYALGYARSVDTTTNAHFWSNFDQRHTVNIFGSYRISQTVNVSTNARYGSGFPVMGYLGPPYIPGQFPGMPANLNIYFPIASVPNQIRMPYYFRMDARINKAFHRKRSKTTLYAEIIDLTNRSNYEYIGFVPDFVRPYGYIAAYRTSVFGILPSVGLSVEF